jgi:hypothetical protein
MAPALTELGRERKNNCVGSVAREARQASKQRAS